MHRSLLALAFLDSRWPTHRKQKTKHGLVLDLDDLAIDVFECHHNSSVSSEFHPIPKKTLIFLDDLLPCPVVGSLDDSATDALSSLGPPHVGFAPTCFHGMLVVLHAQRDLTFSWFNRLRPIQITQNQPGTKNRHAHGNCNNESHVFHVILRSEPLCTASRFLLSTLVLVPMYLQSR